MKPDDLVAIQRASFHQANVLLDQLKKTVNSNFRRLAKELHPDCNGGDPTKTERFMFLARVRSQVETLYVPRPVPPRPGVVWVHPFATMNINGVNVPIPVGAVRVTRFG